MPEATHLVWERFLSQAHEIINVSQLCRCHAECCFAMTSDFLTSSMAMQGYAMRWQMCGTPLKSGATGEYGSFIL